MARVSIKDATRIDWHTNANDVGYPSDDKIKLGCLMRIADATEAMSKNHVKLQEDLDRYKRWYAGEVQECVKLRKQVAGLKGVITKLKKAAQK